VGRYDVIHQDLTLAAVRQDGRMTSQPLPPRRVPARELRPRRYWFAVAALIAMVGATAGIALFVVAVSGATEDFRRPDQPFRVGEPVTARVVAATDKIIWIDGAVGTDRPDCTVSPVDDGDARIESVGAALSYTTGDADWHGLYRLNAARDGQYQVLCQGDPSARLALGDPPQIRGFAGKLGGGLAALFGLPCLGLVGGGVLALVVALRRSAHRKDLAPRQQPT
jgi:hypothetical protein